jgi:hypothetical protein
MAVLALQGRMVARQRELRLVVVKYGWSPRDCAVADGTVLREAARHMVGTRRAVEVIEMTSDANGRRSCESSADMALHASQARMGSGQREPCGLGVIKVAPPGIRAMTGLALGRETGHHMIDGLGRAVVIDVAGRAIRTEALKQAHAGALVTVFALGGCMGPEQRETVCVPVDPLRDLAPSTNTVAFLTIAPQLTAMNVRVAIGALFPNI